MDGELQGETHGAPGTAVDAGGPRPRRTVPYTKHPSQLTPQRKEQAARDFAYYGEPATVAPLPTKGNRWDAVAAHVGRASRFGMPNSHCPGSIALVMMGGFVIRHGQAAGDHF